MFVIRESVMYFKKKRGAKYVRCMGTIAKQFTICIAYKLAGCGSSVSEKPPRTAEDFRSLSL